MVEKMQVSTDLVLRFYTALLTNPRLYDQAQLLPLYLDAYLLTRNPEHLSAVHDIATYLTTAPIQSPNGGFFSAEDADSLYRSTDKEKREGAFYVWTLKEFHNILGDRDAEILARYYNVQDEGNVSRQHDASLKCDGKSSLNKLYNVRCTFSKPVSK